MRPFDNKMQTHGTFGNRDRHVLGDTSRIVECLGQDLSVPAHDKVRVQTETRRITVCPRQMALDILAFGDRRVAFRMVGVFEQDGGKSDWVADRAGSLSQIDYRVRHMRVVGLVEVDAVPTRREAEVEFDPAETGILEVEMVRGDLVR